MNDSNLTNQALGDALGVSHAQASRYRSGDRVPTDLVMLKLWRLMDWPVEDQIALKYQQLERLRQPNTVDPMEGPYAVEFRRREPIALSRIAPAENDRG
jgi:hypothetical protein